jgi:hypothetical protein
MVTQTLNLHGNLEELSAFFLELLREVNFTVILEEDLEAGFRIIGTDRKRMSQLAVTLFSFTGGYLPRNRIATELAALQNDGTVTATLKSSPYIDILGYRLPARYHDGVPLRGPVAPAGKGPHDADHPRPLCCGPDMHHGRHHIRREDSRVRRHRHHILEQYFGRTELLHP